MKSSLVFLAILALSFASPRPRKLFHENYEDFMDLIRAEAGHDLDHLMEHYLEFEEFTKTLDYMRTKDFNNLVHEMEDLPEFKAVIDYLEANKVDVSYFITLLDEMLDQVALDRKSTRHTVSGTDMTAFIKDCIAEFPKAKLAALYDEKIAEDEDFKSAMENLQSEEWNTIYNALWENDTFLQEVQILKDNGIEVDLLLLELIAVFGQN
ncbi:uncharacterized protein LOC126968608 [Leptidea sinapis]|uniref:uncharacterized protein LOC126968608 n=1 Tax=Leptidea sinapis TaxID=189913 RepID=UPI00211F646F|nr:uncharacterized protein LOC126968608 [Leptidea sinapis]